MDMMNFLNRMQARNGLTEAGKQWLITALDPFHDFDFRCRGMPDKENKPTVVECVKLTVPVVAPAGVGTGTWQAHVSINPYIVDTSTSLLAGNATGFLGQESYATDVESVIQSTGVGGSTALPILSRQCVNRLASPPTNDTLANLPGRNFRRNFRFLEIMTSVTGSCAEPGSVQTVASVAGTTVTDVSPTLPPTFMTTQRRIVGAGAEIYNTTAPISASGTMTTYRVPTGWSERDLAAGYFNVNDGAVAVLLQQAINTTYTNYQTSMPGIAGRDKYDVTQIRPATINDAMQYEGTRQWNAIDGAYFAARFHAENPLEVNNVGYLAAVLGDQNANNVIATGGNDSLPTSTGYYMFNRNVFDSSTNRTFTPYFYGAGNSPNEYLRLPLDITGAFATGLSAQTTLTVVFKIFVELAPSIGDANNASLVYAAQPSPDYDPLALELYQRAAAILPPACKVTENPDGEWWQSVLSSLKEVAPDALQAVGQGMSASGSPYGQLGGMVAGGAAGLLRYIRDKDKPVRNTTESFSPPAAAVATAQRAPSRTRSASSGRRVVKVKPKKLRIRKRAKAKK